MCEFPTLTTPQHNYLVVVDEDRVVVVDLDGAVRDPLPFLPLTHLDTTHPQFRKIHLYRSHVHHAFTVETTIFGPLHLRHRHRPPRPIISTPRLVNPFANWVPPQLALAYGSPSPTARRPQHQGTAPPSTDASPQCWRLGKMCCRPRLTVFGLGGVSQP